MCTETSLTLKDFIPLIGTVLTVLTGYVLISVKLKMDRRAKWIDDFRDHYADFLSAASGYNLKRTDASYAANVRKSGMLVRLYLDMKKPKHKAMALMVNEVVDYLGINNAFDMAYFSDTSSKMSRLAIEIIEEEQTALFNFDL